LRKEKFEDRIFAITQFIKNPHEEVVDNSFKAATSPAAHPFCA
jgi:hypothetical protein